jgi:hypothetical protein
LEIGVTIFIGKTEYGKEIGNFTEAISPKKSTEDSKPTTTLYKVFLSATEAIDKIDHVNSCLS